MKKTELKNKENKMKITFIIGYLSEKLAEGTGKLMYNLAEYLHAQGHQVNIITGPRSFDQDLKRFSHLNVTCTKFKLSKVKNLLKQITPDVVCVFTSSPKMALFGSLLKYKRMLVIPSNRFTSLFDKALFKLSRYNQKILTANILKKDYGGLNIKYLGINIPKSTGKTGSISAGKKLIIGYIGAPNKLRGFIPLCDLLQRTVNADSKFNFELRLAVKTLKQQDKTARQIIDSYSFKNKVKHFGDVDINKFISGCDIIVNLLESAKGVTHPPLVSLEAMASSRLIIASDIPIHREIIQDGITGILVSANNLDEKFMVAVKNKKSISKIGKSARKYVQENFDSEKTSADFLNLLKSI